MTSKRKPIRREVRCLYKALLREKGVTFNLKEMIGFFDEYQNLRDRVLRSREAPPSLKAGLIYDYKMPNYLKWVKKYLIKGKKK